MNFAFNIIFLLALTGYGASLRFSPIIPLEKRSSTSLNIKFPELDTASYSGNVVGYEISHRSVLSMNWEIDVNRLGSSGNTQLEQQLITIKVDEHKNLKDLGGSFALGLVRSGLNPQNIEDLTRTPNIEWNSTAIQFKKSLEYLPAIKIKEVRRCGTLDSQFNVIDGSIDWLSSCPYGFRGGYSWLVVFNITVSEGNLPLLYPYRNDLKNTWTGIGDQIMITRLSHGMINTNACRDGYCTYNVTGLQPGTYYSFRVRALISSDGWTEYSKMSEFVPTLDARAPSRPRPPLLASATSSTINYRILNAPITESISTYITEYKCSDCNTWLTGPSIDLSNEAFSRSKEIIFTITALKPLTAYHVRIRAVNNIGVSPFSSPTLMTSTSYPPEATVVSKTPEVVPGSLSNNQVEVKLSVEKSQLLTYGILTYIVQYRNMLISNENSWVNLPNTVFSIKNTTTNIVKQEIEVRADNDVTSCFGYFWLTTTDLTDKLIISDVLTSPLPFNASADDVKHAINKLLLISSGHEVNEESYLQVYQTKNKFNGYRWSVEFHGFTSSVPKFQILKSNLSFFYEQPFVSTYNATDNMNNITKITTTTYKTLKTTCWTGIGAGVITRSLPTSSSLSASADVSDTLISKRILVSGLNEQTPYQFRSVLQLNDGSIGTKISDVLNITTKDSILPQTETKSSLSLSYASLLYSSVGTGISVFESGKENLAPRTSDPFYVSGSAMGGLSGVSGNNGLCVLNTVFPTLTGIPKDAYYNTKYFFFSKKSQVYTIPYDPSNSGYASAKVIVNIKCWGGGGGGGKVSDLGSNTPQDTASLSKGGAGGFAQGSFWLASGESIDVTVGGGGDTSIGEAGGAGGLFGGAGGGSSSKGGGGGGGGGASAVIYNGNYLLIAGGGGGAGSTDYCCAHGGVGGGQSGGNGSYPGDNTPWPISSSLSPTPVKRRFEYTSSQCPIGIEGEWCISEWDTRPHSLPAEHRHLDYGLAAEGNYSAWASSGKGGSQELAGSAGSCGSYILSDFGGSGGAGAVEMGVDERVAVYSLQRGLSVRAGDGRYLEGGVGADGKDCGGGGGGGLWGGGGGGSGIDGAGGGGGSSFINSSYLSADGLSGTTSATLKVLAIPSTPVVDFINSSHIMLSWTLNSQNTLWGQADRFEVEMSSGPNSEDFQYLDTALPQNSEYVSGIDDPVSSMLQMASLYVKGLLPSTSYSFRVIPHFSSGKGTPSAVLSVVTMTTYADVFWEPIWPRRHSLASIGSGMTASALRVATTGSSSSVTSSDERVTDPPTVLTPATPSSRSGHTLSNIHNQVFMFGGRTDGYSCAATYKDFLYLGSPESGRDVYPCTRLPREVNEVWVLDMLTYEWNYLNASLTTTSVRYPSAREQHTAAVVDGNLYIFGGRSSDYTHGKTIVHRDFWRLNVQPLTTEYTSTWDRSSDSGSSLTIPEDKRLYAMINGSADGGNVLNGDGIDARSGMCIHSLTVQVILTHSCASQLRISLFGPGPNAGSANFQPSSYSNEILLFADSSTNGTGCVSGIHNFTFDDTSTRVTNKCCPSNYTGDYQPLGKLAEFAGLSPSAEWTLVVEDQLKDGQVGSLTAWSILFVLEPCTRTYSWTNLTSTIWSSHSPSARYHASAIVYGKQIFIFNGLGPGDTPLNDLYRFNTLDSTWTKLSAVDFDITSWEHTSIIGASFSLTPWGLLRYGGYSRLPEMNANFSSYSNDVYLWDPYSMRWSWLEVQPCPIASNFSDKLYPSARYLSAITFIPSGSLNWKSSFSEKALFDTPVSSSFANYAGGAMLDSLFMFGGFNGASGSIYDGSSGGLLNDLWMLRFRNRSTSSFREVTNKRRNYVCLWRSTSRFFNDQLHGCLGSDYSPCLFNNLVMLAWCAGSNQTVT